MPDADDALRSMRERLAGSGEDRLGKALSELLENPLFTSAVTCAFDARELAVHAQEMAMTLLNIPSAADVERLTRRLRSMSQRMEGVEDALFRVESALTGGGVEARLTAIEDRLVTLLERLANPPTTRTAEPAEAPSGLPPDAPERPPAQPPARPATPSARKPAPRTPRSAPGRSARTKRG
jgi:hypothetical protein